MASQAELRELRGELRDAGLFEHCELRSWLKLGVLVGGVAASLVTMATFGAWTALFAIPIAAVFATAAAMVAHEGSHRSFSASPTRNALMVYMVFPLFTGLGSLYWRHKHDRLHHGHPNVEGVDPDIKPFPFVSSRGDHEKCGPKQRWFVSKLQRWAFWPMSTLLAVGMRRSSFLYLIRYPREHGIKAAWCVEALCMTGHYVLWYVIPCFIWGPVATLLVNAGIWGLVGVMLTLVFAPAHIGLPVLVEPHHDWQHQLETTRNLQLPRVISFFFIGLDYQVEHHLFPKIPHQKLPAAAAITARWCKKHGVPYQSVPYMTALKDSAQFMADAWTRDAEYASVVRARMLDAVG
ncbi:MAG TPA: acyl-CoA desaturase [Kofleriaceae bacterium]|nr:acyl-CoA desaturase [Kofleriaceae bacterium]